MASEIWKYEGFIKQLEESDVDVTTCLIGLINIAQNGVNPVDVIDLIWRVTERGSLMPSLDINTIERALAREQKLLLSYQERATFPHLRGGRKPVVKIYADIAKTEGAETAIRWATRAGLSKRSIYRLKRAIADAV